MRRRLVVGAAVLAVVLVGLELAAVPIAARVLGSALSRCVAYERLELTSVARPVVPRLVVGRARDVVLEVSEVEAGGLRVADARLVLPEAVLPWAVGDPQPGPARLELRVDEADAQQALRELLPVDLPLTLELQPGSASIGVAPLPLRSELTVDLTEDGTVRLSPAAGGEALWDRLGLRPEIAAGESARVTAVSIGDGEVAATLALEVVPGVGGGDCADLPT